MKFLERERQTLEQYIPHLDKALAEVPLHVLESKESPGIGLFRDSAGPGLLVPTEFGGSGANAVDAVRVQRALGARSPSLAVATTMHHFSMASIVSLGDDSTGFEWLLLEAVARDHRLVSSAFAEGKPGQPILSPGMQATPVEDGYLVSGRKKPCSLSRSMDLITAGIAVDGDDGKPVMAVAVIPTETPGVRIEPFWNSWALAGAESEEVVIEDAFVHRDLVIETSVGFGHQLDKLTLYSFLWFELLITASYVGAVSALAERVFEKGRAPKSDQVQLLCEVEGAALQLEGLAREHEAAEHDNEAFARLLIGRFAIQDALARAASSCIELLGGVAFVSSPDVALLLASSHALALHPPNRTGSIDSFTDYINGGRINVT
ncbi:MULTISPECIES: acyl-CoA dehydrogenase family protein [Streptomyces]|uniref:Oxidoreductase n=1 Tax=Streptomyces cacaoi TaxID=1898 RepID=A0A4Y3QUN7_STRCI|nr:MULTISPECIES: acyl-CoA dehydrogenase family protein [Streptomyces]NNG87320.1 acyl-CoA/acyl-ACP dehydrogenase [Streptomyces cacaoi]QHF97389.1 acyl-CoA dehydrogenase [Streptomyces sp. NHF165]GEB48912.1 oxidoreductase [Streptomyces cacaoi]